MSATRDKNQKIAFVYSNMYELYRKGKKAAQESDIAPFSVRNHQNSATDAQASAPAETATVPAARVHSPLEETHVERPVTHHVLKAAQVNQTTPISSIRINSFTPPEFISKRIVQKPEYLRPNPAVESLKQNLKSLNDLHSRLRFMLQELEELISEPKGSRSE